MERIVYLLGTGSTKAEMHQQGIESDITMAGIGENVLRLSEEKRGEYWRIHRSFSLPADQDVEIIMSLLEGFTDLEKSEFKDVCNEIRGLFREYLITQIAEKKVNPKIHSSLLHLHKYYGDKMGKNGEELRGVLTINYDSVMDEAFKTVHQAINYGYDFVSTHYKKEESLPPLLKLHGSFNWRIQGNRLTASKEFEDRKYVDDCRGWMPPSVYKKPEDFIFQSIWDKARELITNCDVLRIIGSSLRAEDFALISLIFTSQLKSRGVFSIELIVPDKDALGEEKTTETEAATLGIMRRLRFLGKLRNFSSLPVFEEESYNKENIFYSWVLMKVREIERNSGKSLNDEFINKMLLLEV